MFALNSTLHIEQINESEVLAGLSTPAPIYYSSARFLSPLLLKCQQTVGIGQLTPLLFLHKT